MRRIEGFAEEHTMRRFFCLVLWLLSGVSLAAEPSFTPLPDLPGGAVGTFVTALSANGEVAVGFSASDFHPAFQNAALYPFRWARDTGMVALSEWPGLANDVSADGSVVVGRYSLVNPPRPEVAFRWAAETDIVNLPDLNELGTSHAYSVSSDGTTVAGKSGGQAVLWVDGGSPLDLGVATTLTVFISSDGSVAAGTDTTPFAFDAFRWTAAEGAVSLGDLPGRAGGASVRDMTPDGRVIVGTQGTGFVWMAETGMIEIANFSPYALSDDGGVMVGVSAGRPALWTEGTGAMELQPFLAGLGLDLTGWTLTDVRAISGDGTTIAGHGIPPDPSMSGAWIATIPEPSTWLLGGIALSTAAIGVLSRRRVEGCTKASVDGLPSTFGLRH
jgi:uncharacterized membrane protein